MFSANSVMKDIWMNVSVASGNDVTIDRDYLYYLLTELEKNQYNKGYSDGHENCHSSIYNKLPSDIKFEGTTRKWS